MSAFSRGFTVRALIFIPPKAQTHLRCTAQTLRSLLRARLIPLRRSFQTFPRQRAIANPSKHSPVPATTSPQVTSLAEQLAKKGAPTILYEAPSHFWFTVSSVSAGLFCMSWPVVNYWSLYVYPPPNLTWWVPHAFAVVCLVMAGMGTYFMMGPSQIIKTIRAVPATRALVSGGGKKGVAAVATKAGAASTPIYLEISTRRFPPFLPLKRTLAEPANVVMPGRMAALLQHLEMVKAAAAAPTTRERVAQKRAEEERRRSDYLYDRSHILTAPFRHAGRAIAGAYREAARALIREGFAKVTVNGKEYKLDATGGWALENGRVLDRLVSVRQIQGANLRP